MIIYLDENMPAHLAKGFNILQLPENHKTGYNLEVRHLPADFEYGAEDIEWIPAAGKRKACIITQDINIQRRKHELELYREHKLGMFFLKGPSKKKGLKIWDMVTAMAKNWTEICKVIHEQKRPFAYEFGLNKKLKQLS